MLLNLAVSIDIQQVFQCGVRSLDGFRGSKKQILKMINYFFILGNVTATTWQIDIIEHFVGFERNKTLKDKINFLDKKRNKE